MRKSKLSILIEEKKNEGWEMVQISSGQIAPQNPRSKLYHALQDATNQYPDHDINYLVGSHKWRGADGFNFAIIIRPQVDVITTASAARK